MYSIGIPYILYDWFSCLLTFITTSRFCFLSFYCIYQKQPIAYNQVNFSSSSSSQLTDDLISTWFLMTIVLLTHFQNYIVFWAFFKNGQQRQRPGRVQHVLEKSSHWENKHRERANGRESASQDFERKECGGPSHLCWSWPKWVGSEVRQLHADYAPNSCAGTLYNVSFSG